MISLHNTSRQRSFFSSALCSPRAGERNSRARTFLVGIARHCFSSAPPEFRRRCAAHPPAARYQRCAARVHIAAASALARMALSFKRAWSREKLSLERQSLLRERQSNIEIGIEIEIEKNRKRTQRTRSSLCLSLSRERGRQRGTLSRMAGSRSLLRVSRRHHPSFAAAALRARQLRGVSVAQRVCISQSHRCLRWWRSPSSVLALERQALAREAVPSQRDRETDRGT